ncbi:MAG: DUF1501 domain-containing protein [Planctomycetaceae bacterium]|nr:DUF1501 domain-containing protein [Planctomycetaceae bacterium]MCP4811020.1 DUF1501 domain-containing protein [Planctomycetaceae bacterium]
MPTNLNRRQFVEWSTHGLGSIALLELLQQDGVLAAAEPAGTETSHAPRVKRAIQICLVGGMSHVDSYDYKPELTKKQGKTLGSDEKPDIFFGKVGLLRGSDWEYKQRGESGLWISEMFPHIAKMADELTLMRSMVSDSANHTPALFVSNSGFQANGFPSLGSWLSYGLGSETEALPSFVVLPDERGGPNGGASNWTSGFLPGQNQGVVFTGGDQPVRDLFPARDIAQGADQDTRKFIEYLNRKHLDKIGQDERLLSRIRSYELAARLQTSIPEVSRYADEPEAIRKLYGIDEKKTADMGRRCLLGRRLLERGVRFVQVYSGGPIAGSPRASWDAHESVKDNHSLEAGRIDQPVAALLQDLKQRDMLKDTLVIFTTEFGRTPFAQSAANQVGPGRDHNRYGFSCWLAGGGLRAGTSYGQTDEIGWKAVENPVTWNDFHATILHLFGIEHEQLTFYHNGIQRRLTNVAGDVVTGILS